MDGSVVLVLEGLNFVFVFGCLLRICSVFGADRFGFWFLGVFRLSCSWELGIALGIVEIVILLRF